MDGKMMRRLCEEAGRGEEFIILALAASQRKKAALAFEVANKTFEATREGFIEIIREHRIEIAVDDLCPVDLAEALD